jgi:hypothetical protein
MKIATIRVAGNARTSLPNEMKTDFPGIKPASLSFPQDAASSDVHALGELMRNVARS